MLDISLGVETFRRQSEAISWKSRYLRGTKSKLIIEPLSLEELIVLRRKPMTTPTLKPNKIEIYPDAVSYISIG